MGTILKNGISYGGGGGGSGAGDLYVHVTYTTGSGYAVDHTYAEVVQNIANGGTPIVEYKADGGSPTYYGIRAVLPTHVTFGTTNLGGTGLFLLYASGGVSFAQTQLTQTTTVTVAASSWTNGQAVLSWSALQAANTAILGYPASTSATDYEIMRAADIRVIGQAAGSITIKALGTVPTSDLTFQITRW